jgi:hypothetical protein
MRHICTSLSRAVGTAIFRLPIVGLGDIINTEDSFLYKERLVNTMGGTVIQTESKKLVQRGKQQGIQQGIRAMIEMGQEYGLDDAAILKKLQDKVGLSLEQASAYLEKYGKQPA